MFYGRNRGNGVKLRVETANGAANPVAKRLPGHAYEICGVDEKAATVADVVYNRLEAIAHFSISVSS